MKKLLFIVTLAFLAYFLPKEDFMLVLVVIIGGNVMKNLIQHAGMKYVDNPWLSIKHPPEIFSIDKYKLENEVATFKIVEVILNSFSFFVNILSLTYLLFLVTHLVQNKQMLVVSYFIISFLMLPVMKISHDNYIRAMDKENKYSVIGTYKGYKSKEIQPNTIWFGKKSNRAYECFVAEIMVKGKIFEVVCYEEEMEELSINDEVVVYSPYGKNPLIEEE